MNKKIERSFANSEKSVDIIDQIPNGIHLHTIREALRKGHASVMVGAGFSLNALGGDKLPTWNQLIDGLLGDLYPNEIQRKKSKARLGGTSGMLRLAEEYSAVRGRAQLDSRMHELLPDAGVVMPGELHTRLLSLYWNDVFTTNYDTLLERALDTDRSRFNPRIKPRYQVVVEDHDVPFSRRNGQPRIVKLHGSLRSGTRLIVTEDDYRKYPVDFAPFVNTVQQSMLENVFCLIGFSGDDPNFLLWTGWARDHLGDKAPPVYLIMLSQIPEGQRIILEKRKIFPINIADLGKVGDTVNYRKALSALLDFWHDEPPIRAAKWPFHRPWSATTGHKPDILELTKWVRAVQQNRNDYPGWLVAPADNRIRLFQYSSHWMALNAFRSNAKFMPQWLKFVFFEEIVWIFDIAMKSLPPFLIGLIEAELNVPQIAEKSSGEPLLADGIHVLRPDDGGLEVIKARLAIAMLRNAREIDNRENFIKWKTWLNGLPLGLIPSELRCTALHEDVLFCLEHRDKESALNLLIELESAAASESDPYWRIRTGALFGEIGVIRRGYELVRSGLHGIRDAIQFEGESPYLVSREQWSEWLLGALDYASKEDERENKATRRPSNKAFKFWSPEPGLRARIDLEEQRAATQNQEDKVERDESARDNVEHPNFQMDAVRRELEIADQMLNAASIKIDSSSISEKKRVAHLRDEAKEEAFTYVRLIERAGLPPYLGNIGFTASTLMTSYRILSLTVDPNSNMRILSRVSGGVTFGPVDALELPAISSLTAAKAQEIFDQSVNVINSLTADVRWDRRAASSLNALLDLASRVAFRLDTSHATILCNLAVRLYALQALREDYNLHGMFASFFARAIRLLPPKELGAISPTLLALSSSDIPFYERHSWPDVMIALNGSPISIRRGKQWSAVVDQVIDETENLRADHQDRMNYCIRRLEWLYRNGLMSQSQRSKFAKIIWQKVDSNGFPQIPNFYFGSILCLPSPSGRSNVTRVFRKWLKTKTLDPIEKLTDFLGEQKMGLSPPYEELLVGLLFTKNKNVSFKLSEQDVLSILEIFRDWWRTEGARLIARDVALTNEFVLPRLRLISQVINRVFSEILSLKTIQERRLDEWFEELWNYGVKSGAPLVPLLFAGLRWWPDRAMDVIDVTISTTNSIVDRHVLTVALTTASNWLLENESPIEPSRRYTNYLVDTVCSGSEFQIEMKLNTIAELLEAGGRKHFQSHLRSLSVALCFMLQDLQKAVADSNMEFNSYARPLLRVAIVKVLVAMGENLDGAQHDPMWICAVDHARSDPLQLVRKLVS